MKKNLFSKHFSYMSNILVWESHTCASAFQINVGQFFSFAIFNLLGIQDIPGIYSLLIYFFM